MHLLLLFHLGFHFGCLVVVLISHEAVHILQASDVKLSSRVVCLPFRLVGLPPSVDIWLPLGLICLLVIDLVRLWQFCPKVQLDELPRS